MFFFKISRQSKYNYINILKHVKIIFIMQFLNKTIHIFLTIRIFLIVTNIMIGKRNIYNFQNMIFIEVR